MTIKLKPDKEILLKILRVMFMKDLKDAKLCASDTLVWVLKDEKLIESHFWSWLKKEGYAE